MATMHMPVQTPRFVDYPKKILGLCRDSNVRAPEIIRHFGGEWGGKANGLAMVREVLIDNEAEIKKAFPNVFFAIVKIFNRLVVKFSKPIQVICSSCRSRDALDWPRLA